MRRVRHHLALGLALTVLAGGCQFFAGDDVGDGDLAGDSETGDGDTDEPNPPRRGFRVFPKYMLQDLPAIVVLAGDSGIAVEGCAVDELDGGYVCDADALSSGSLAIVAVERDGFEPAVRELEVPFNQIVPVDVHLAVEGGPPGVWSACVPVGELTDCNALCAAELDAPACLVTSCATDNPEVPIATFESFADADCLERILSEPAPCEAGLPEFETAAVRCCCG